MPKVFIASDHAGFEMKAALIAYVSSLGYLVEDFGAREQNPDDDYPDFIIPCVHRVAAVPGSFGIVIGGSGQGEGMAANRVAGVRSGVWYGGTFEMVSLMREHNDANVLSIAARFVSIEEAKRAAALFLKTPFSNAERHRRRLAKF